MRFTACVKRGNPVDGLTQNDFVLHDQGAIQKSPRFSVESLKSAPPREALPRGVFTNDWLYTSRSVPPNATVILTTMNRVRYTLQAIEANSRHISRLPGRKNLVWVSGSFPISIARGLIAPWS
jgi:hypothetical protein